MGFTSYYDFKLGDKKLSDFGGSLYNGEDDAAKKMLLPTMNNSTEELPLIDGTLLYASTYQPRPISLNILIDNNNFDEAAFINWIKSKTPQWFNYVGDNRKIKVVYEDEIIMTMYNNRQSIMTVKFVAHDPYWYLIDDVVFTKESPIITIPYTFSNGGNDISFPLIKLKCSTNQSIITFELNGKQFKLTSLINEVYIDFYTETVYTLINDGTKINKLSTFECLNGKYKYEFGNLNVGNNSIKITQGTLTSIVVYCRSRFI